MKSTTTNTFGDNLKNIPTEEIKEIPSLPLSHNCCSATLEDIFEGKTIKLKYNKDLKDLVCFFSYGKPVYLNSTKFYEPVFLLFKLKDKKEFYGIAPFDTGAFNKIFSKKLNPGSIKLDRFVNHNVDMDYPKKIIYKFFQNNYNYYRNRYSLTNDPLELQKLNVSGKYYDELCKKSHSGDARKYSIEVHFDKELRLIEDLILIYAFLPDNFNLDHESMLRNFFPDIRIEKYDATELRLDNGIYGVVKEAYLSIRRFLKNQLKVL